MSSLTTHPMQHRPLRGTAVLPGDKSLSHRAILFAALAEGESVIDNLLLSGVTQAMLQALTDLGVPWSLRDTHLRVNGHGLRGLRSPATPIHCGNSATTLRLLAGALVAANISAVLDGTPGLRRRPMGRIVEPLQAMGVSISATAGCAPLSLTSTSQALRPLHPQSSSATLPVASAQVKSCLLLAGLAATGPTTLIEPGPSRDHTERMLRQMGVTVTAESLATGQQQVTLIPPTAALRPLHLTIPGDISAAAFLIVAGLIVPGSQITLPGVGLNPTRTGLLDALHAMGADITVLHPGEIGGEPVGDLLIRAGELHGTEIAGSLVVRMIDEFPAFAIAAALAEGTTIVRDAAELRHKESDRITALCQELRQIGADITEQPDGFIIQGRPFLTGGKINAHGDHRLAMSLAVSGLRSRQGVTVPQAEIIHESFPTFAATLDQLTIYDL